MTSQDPRNGEEQKSRQRPPGDGRGPAPQPPRFSGNIFGWLLLGGLAVLLIISVNSTQTPMKEIDWTDLLSRIQSDSVESIVVEDERVVATLKKNAPGQAATPGQADSAKASSKVYVKSGLNTRSTYVKELIELGVKYKEDPGSNSYRNFFLSFIPWIIILLLFYFLVFRSLRNMGGGGGMLGNFGRSRHKVISKEMTTQTLADVAGIDEAKEEIGEIIEFLKNPKKFQRLGGRIPRGVLLVGPPGCGKTLLAKAMAGEAEVPFFSISGSDFVEMFVGVGASRVRDLFKQAKDNSPCIIFLDEIDAVGRRRGTGYNSGGHDEREQTLNAILVEMDGFETDDQVIVVAATNRSDVLDPALTRPGRFDRQIEVQLPDVQGRFQILKVHAKRIKLSPNVNLERIARGTPMFSGADLAALINESAIIATMATKDFVDMDDLEEARDKVRFGRLRKGRKVEDDDRVSTAYHEAGHAVLQILLKDADPLHKVTIIPRGRALGATMSFPEKDRYGYGQRFVAATMRVLCGGRIAEQRKTGDITSGAAMDIQMATNFARYMILDWGMSKRLGFVNYAMDDRNQVMPEKAYSDETARIIDEEVKRIIDEAYVDAERLINEHWDKVVCIAEALLKFETLSAEEVQKLIAGQPLDREIDIFDKPSTPPAAPPVARPTIEPLAGPDSAGPMPSPA